MDILINNGCESLKIEYDLDRLRSLGKLIRKQEFTTNEATAFLLLYREQLTAKINECVRQFMDSKLYSSL